MTSLCLLPAWLVGRVSSSSSWALLLPTLYPVVLLAPEKRHGSGWGTSGR